MIAVSSSRPFSSTAYYYIMAFVKKLLRSRFCAQKLIRIHGMINMYFDSELLAQNGCIVKRHHRGDMRIFSSSDSAPTHCNQFRQDAYGDFANRLGADV